jgi:hypothetical protein
MTKESERLAGMIRGAEELEGALESLEVSTALLRVEACNNMEASWELFLVAENAARNRRCAVSDNAFMQMVRTYGVPVRYAQRLLSEDVRGLAHIFNGHINRDRKDKRRLLIDSRKDGGTLLGYLDTETPLWPDSLVLRSAHRVLTQNSMDVLMAEQDESRVYLHGKPFGGWESFNGFWMYRVGVFVRNSAVGDGPLMLRPTVQLNVPTPIPEGKRQEGDPPAPVVSTCVIIPPQEERPLPASPERMESAVWDAFERPGVHYNMGAMLRNADRNPISAQGHQAGMELLPYAVANLARRAQLSAGEAGEVAAIATKIRRDSPSQLSLATAFALYASRAHRAGDIQAARRTFIEEAAGVILAHTSTTFTRLIGAPLSEREMEEALGGAFWMEGRYLSPREA